MPTLASDHRDILDRHGADYASGFTASAASRRRSEDGGFVNTVSPPLNCPSWVCCLLPCIKHIPSMKKFRNLRPDDAEVLRDGRWVNYDAPSLVRGDVIRLSEGDGVPADCVVLSLGMDHAAVGDAEEGEPRGDRRESFQSEAEGYEVTLVADVSSVTGEHRPRTVAPRGDGTAEPVRLYYGGRVLQGCGIAVVTAVGPHTALAILMREGRWPPREGRSFELEGRDEGNSGDKKEETDTRVSLIKGVA